MGHFEDVEDAGDEYSFCPFKDSRPISTIGQKADVHLVQSGPNQITYEIRRELHIPVGLDENRQRRSADWVGIPIITRLSLYRDQPGIFFETDVNNRATDHKLSVVFPTQLNPETVSVDQAFLIMKREIDLPDSTGWVEDPSPLMHQRAFIDLSQDGHGLAILNRGLPAVEAARLAGGVKISLTLLRCVGWLSRDDLWNRRVAAGPIVPTPQAQCQGNYHFEYAVLPHVGDVFEVYRPAYNYISPLLATRADTHEGLDLREMNITQDNPDKVRYIPWKRTGHLPDTLSFVSLYHQELVMSSVHRARNKNGERRGWFIRFYNITDKPVTAQLKSGLPVKEAWITDLEENRLQAIPFIHKDTLEFQVNGNQIITLELI
jgi:alpha-mannosidase